MTQYVRSTSILLPVLAMVGSITFLGIGTSYAKQLFPLLGAQGTSALRVGLSALVLILVWRPWRKALNRTDLATLLRFGVALGLMNLLFYMSIQTIPFGIAVAIEFTGPLAVALFYSRRKYDYLWVLLACIGILLLLPLGAGSSHLDIVGILYALAAAVCWGCYIVFGKRAGHLGAGQAVSLGMLTAAMIVVPVGVHHAGALLLSPEILLIGIVVAIVSSAIPISLEMFALKRLPKETFGIMVSMEPAIAAIVAMFMLQEILSLQQWVAIACIVSASAGSVASLKNRTKSAEIQKAA